MSVLKQKLAVAVMVTDKDRKLLLVHSFRRGWEFPGGYVGPGETIPAAAVREVKEETGIDIELIRFCGVEQDEAQSLCVFLFEGKPVGGTLAVSNESIETAFMTVEEATKRITLKMFRKRLTRCLDETSEPFFCLIGNPTD